MCCCAAFASIETARNGNPAGEIPAYSNAGGKRCDPAGVPPGGPRKSGVHDPSLYHMSARVSGSRRKNAPDHSTRVARAQTSIRPLGPKAAFETKAMAPDSAIRTANSSRS